MLVSRLTERGIVDLREKSVVILGMNHEQISKSKLPFKVAINVKLKM